MPWYAWYSAKQEQLYGYANYINRKGQLVNVTELNQDERYKHPYTDSIRLGLVTHFCGVQKRNHTKRRGREPCKMMPSEMRYQHDCVLGPHLISN
jgi:hypothetical protein